MFVVFKKLILRTRFTASDIRTFSTVTFSTTPAPVVATPASHSLHPSPLRHPGSSIAPGLSVLRVIGMAHVSIIQVVWLRTREGALVGVIHQPARRRRRAAGMRGGGGLGVRCTPSIPPRVTKHAANAILIERYWPTQGAFARSTTKVCALEVDVLQH